MNDMNIVHCTHSHDFSKVLHKISRLSGRRWVPWCCPLGFPPQWTEFCPSRWNLVENLLRRCNVWRAVMTMTMMYRCRYYYLFICLITKKDFLVPVSKAEDHLVMLGRWISWPDGCWSGLLIHRSAFYCHSYKPGCVWNIINLDSNNICKLLLWRDKYSLILQHLTI